MDTNKTKKKWKELGIDALFDFAGAFLQAVGVWCFIEPSRIAPGGVSGIALMLNHLFALPIGAVSLVINIPLLLAAWCLLDRSMTLKTVRTVIWMSVIQDLVSMAGIWQYEGDRLISCGRYIHLANLRFLFLIFLNCVHHLCLSFLIVILTLQFSSFAGCLRVQLQLVCYEDLVFVRIDRNRLSYCSIY